MTTPEQERYEAIYRVVVRRAQTSLFICWGLTVLLTFVTSVAVTYFGPDLPPAWPAWLRVSAFLIPAFVVVGVVPGVIQVWYLGNPHVRALEVVNGFTLAETEQYTRETGRRRPPRPRNREAVVRLLATDVARGSRLRVRFLLWADEQTAAAQAINELPTDEPAGAFHRELLIELQRFVREDTMDLSRPRQALEAIPPGPERDRARLALAFEEARLAHANGGSWLDPLVAARSEVDHLPRGASMRERVIAGLPTTIVILAILAFLVWRATIG